MNSSISFNIKYGLGMISYKYDEANAFFKDQEERAKKSLFNDSDISVKESVVIVSRPSNENEIKKSKIIDLNSLI